MVRSLSLHDGNFLNTTNTTPCCIWLCILCLWGHKNKCIVLKAQKACSTWDGWRPGDEKFSCWKGLIYQNPVLLTWTWLLVSQVNVPTLWEPVNLPCFDQCRMAAVGAKLFKSCPGFTPHLQFQKELNPHSLGLVTDCPHNTRCSYIAVWHPHCCPVITVCTFRKQQNKENLKPQFLHFFKAGSGLITLWLGSYSIFIQST